MGLIADKMKMPEPARQDKPVAGQPQPEETYKRLGLAAMRIVYGKGTTEPLLEMLKTGEADPARAVAQAAMVVIAKIKKNIKDARRKTSAYSIAPAVVVFLIEMGDAANVFEGSVDLITDSLKILSEMSGQNYGAQAVPQEAPVQSGGMGAPQEMMQQPAQPMQMGA